jgi:WD40 repeat protein
LLVASANNTINNIDLFKPSIATIGGHLRLIRDIYYNVKRKSLISFSFDKKIKFWDLKTANACHTLELPHKPYASDVVDPVIVSGLS